MLTFIQTNGVYLGFWIGVLASLFVAARLWLVGPLERAIDRNTSALLRREE